MADKHAIDRLLCLQALLLEPRNHVERRFERISLRPGGAQSVTCEVLIRIPGGATRKSPRQQPVPLGLFPRKRHPDLQVRAADGSRLVILPRQQRGALLAQLIVQTHASSVEEFVASRRTIESSEDEAALRLPRELFQAVYAILSSDSADDAADALAGLTGLIDGWIRTAAQCWHVDLEAVLKDLRENERLWAALESLVPTEPLLVLVDVRRNDRILIEYTYGERISFEFGDSYDPADGVELAPRWRRPSMERNEHRIAEVATHRPTSRRRQAWGILRGFGMRFIHFLGLTSVTLARQSPNADHAVAYYLQVDVDDSTEITRCYWRHRRAEPVADDHAGADPQVSRLEVVHRRDGSPTNGYVAHIEVQATSFGTIRVACALAGFLLIVHNFVIRHWDLYTGPGDHQTTTVAMLQVFTGIPGLLVAILSVRGLYADSLTTGQRVLAGATASSSVLVAGALGLRPEFDAINGTVAYVALVSSGLLFFVLAHRCFGPRCRLGGWSRYHLWYSRLWATCLHPTVGRQVGSMPAARRRYDQSLYAMVLLGGALVFMTGFAAWCHLERGVERPLPADAPKLLGCLAGSLAGWLVVALLAGLLALLVSSPSRVQRAASPQEVDHVG